jgi:hypothetical protein
VEALGVPMYLNNAPVIEKLWLEMKQEEDSIIYLGLITRKCISNHLELPNLKFKIIFSLKETLKRKVDTVKIS